MNDQRIHFRTFLLLLAAVSFAFIVVLLPFYGAIFWGAILAVIFSPMHRRIRARMPNSPNLAALTSLAIITLMVIVPVFLIAASMVQEGAALYKRMSSGQLNLGLYFEQVFAALPPSIHDLLVRFGMDDILSLREKLSAAALAGSRMLATQAVNVGQNTFMFIVSLGIMLYLLYFLLRDGAQLARHFRQNIPLQEDHLRHLIRKFTTVVRATVKGNIVVAATQGALGGVMFWFLGIQGALFWGVMMALLSLLPAVGASLIWAPVAIYFLVTGNIGDGVILILYGVLVIGLVDNILRPILVGKDTKIPDYIILISTLGGLSVFGLNGFVMGPLFAALFISCWDLFPSAIRMNQDATRRDEVSARTGLPPPPPPRDGNPR